MFISQILVTTWLAFSVGQAVHDDYAKRRQDVEANFIIGDDDNFCTGSDCGEDCWRPLWCQWDTRSCPGGVSLRRCGVSCQFPRCPRPICPADVFTCRDGTTLNRAPDNNCDFPQCPTPMCPTDVFTCRDGTILNRDPETCDFPECPRPPTCSPSLGFHTCPDGSRVGRDPDNLCITWLPCPTAFQCRNGEEIPMNLVCDGIPHCWDGSDEWESHGCQEFGIGRRSEETEEEASDLMELEFPDLTELEFSDDLDQEDAFELMELESTDLTELEFANDLDYRRRQSSRYNCYTRDSQRRWSVGKKRWCCARRGIACQYVTPTPSPSPRPPYNCWFDPWYPAKRKWCCANRGLGCPQKKNGKKRDRIGRRREETELTDQESASELMELESTDLTELESTTDLDQRRRQGSRYNCYTRDSQRRWTGGKKRWCRARRGIACRYVTPTPSPSPRPPYNCWFDPWYPAKRKWCCANRGLGCNTKNRKKRDRIGRRREETELTDQEGASELMELESTDLTELESTTDLDQRRRQGSRYNCYTRDSQSRWSVGKKRWCCARRGIACQYVTPTPAPSPRFNCLTRERWSPEKRRWCCANRGLGCRDNQNEYTHDGEYNCYYGRQSGWTWQKRSFCCSNQRIGCNSGPTSPSGPSIGGRRAEVELNEEPELDREE